MAAVTSDVAVPPAVTITSYQRHRQGHGFEVSWPLPARVRWDHCRREEKAYLEYKNGVPVVRDVDLWGQPSLWIYQPAYPRCPYGGHRQHRIPPFKRKDTADTYRCERHVVSALSGSNVAAVARRLGRSAELVEFIIHHQLADARDKQVDPGCVSSDVGSAELSLEKRPKL